MNEQTRPIELARLLVADKRISAQLRVNEDRSSTYRAFLETPEGKKITVWHTTDEQWKVRIEGEQGVIYVTSNTDRLVASTIRQVVNQFDSTTKPEKVSQD